MHPTSPATAVVNGVTVDLDSETLRAADGTERVLRPQSFATLRYLIESPNRLVTKDELMQAVWHGVAVTDDSLVQCIHEIPPGAGRRPARGAADGGAPRLPAGHPPGAGRRDAADRRVDRGAAVRRARSGRRRRLLRGRAGRGPHHQPLEDRRALRDRPQLVLRLSGWRGGPAAGRGRARGALPAAGQRPAVGRRAPDQRAAGRRRLGGASLGRTVRRVRGRRLRATGPADRADRRGDRAVDPPGRDRAGAAQASREPRRLRPLPACVAARAGEHPG